MTRPGITTERLLALFLLGIVAFTPPFLGIFNTPRLILGIPILYLYLFGMWALLIALVALTVRHPDDVANLVRRIAARRIDRRDAHPVAALVVKQRPPVVMAGRDTLPQRDRHL